ncbi:hypothetical protein EDC01DRAFT_361309 [Geopyxis carbonaria]|nr:hypothetical protein EDC01DRAFT_361309 [Geopyxis carbonaria]
MAGTQRNTSAPSQHLHTYHHHHHHGAGTAIACSAFCTVFYFPLILFPTKVPCASSSSWVACIISRGVLTYTIYFPPPVLFPSSTIIIIQAQKFIHQHHHMGYITVVFKERERRLFS